MPTIFTLYHHPLDAFARRVRLALGEREIAFESIVEKPWDLSETYRALNPSGELPTLIVESKDGKVVVSDTTAICEYVEETQGGRDLLGKDAIMRAEVRRLVQWFERKFFTEVTTLLFIEKAMKRLQGTGEPDSLRIRAGYHNIHGHLDYIGWLTQRRNWLAGDNITLADLAAAAQLSVIDYLGDVPWENHTEARDWYARIKSRPCFRPLLGDHIPGLMPASHYADLDF